MGYFRVHVVFGQMILYYSCVFTISGFSNKDITIFQIHAFENYLINELLMCYACFSFL